MDNLDLIRVGVYTQMEGSFYIHRPSPTTTGGDKYTFRFAKTQIKDMKELLERVVDKQIIENKRNFEVISKELYATLLEKGFLKFSQRNWNVPPLDHWSHEEKKEYFRATIDSLGYVGYDNEARVQITSINRSSMCVMNVKFGGTLSTINSEGNRLDRCRLEWTGNAAKYIVNYLDNYFYNSRHNRGIKLIHFFDWKEFA